MTLDQTRQLGIEFERRVQTMIPETESIQKLDTETIYSFLNQFQDKYIHDIYKLLDNIPTPSKMSLYFENILLGLLSNYEEEYNDGSFNLPEDFGLYINSVTYVDNAYSYKSENQNSGYLPNTLIAQSQVHQLLLRPLDNMRIIREPVAYFSKKDDNKILKVIYDKYTVPKSISINYYRIPNYMNLFTKTACELPMDAFEDLVSGAVDLYVQYVAGAEARKRQQQEAQLQQQKNRLEDEQ